MISHDVLLKSSQGNLEVKTVGKRNCGIIETQICQYRPYHLSAHMIVAYIG